jgi:hypothetical protein
MKITAQGFISSNDMPFRKATTYLWPTNTPAGGRFALSDTDPLFIDAPNFASWERGNPAIRHEPFEDGSTGFGTMWFSEFGAGNDRPKLHYPVRAEKARRYDVYIRYKTDESKVNVDLFLDKNMVQQIDEIVGVPGDWNILQTEFVIPDKTDRTLTLSVLTNNVHVDYICLVPDGALPGTVEYDQYPYITVHAGVHQLVGNEPGQLGPFYDSKSTFEELQLDDEYNFDMKKATGSTVDYDDNFVFSLYPVGSSDDSYVVWDLASDTVDPYIALQSFSNEDNAGWQTSDTRFALTMWFFVDALDETGCIINTPPAEAFISRTNKFDDPDTEPVFVNTNIQNDDGVTNEVALQLPDRIVSLLVDQSGSMTWNDQPKTRHEILRRLINRLDSTYPGLVSFNLYSFESTPIRVNFFAVLEDEEVDTADGGAVADAFFADQESGYAGVRVLRKEALFSTNAIDGDIVTEGFLDRSFDDNLIENEDYFYTVYTFDRFGTFSNGNRISAVPRPRILPNGIGTFGSTILRGSGIKLDENVNALWHFNEAAGLEAFDFTTNQYHLSAFNQEEPRWLNEEDTPIGRSGVRLNGSDQYWKHTRSVPSVSLMGEGDGFTFMAWILPFEQATPVPEFVFAERGPSGSGLDGFGFFLLRSGSELQIWNRATAALVTTSSPLVQNEWNHVAVTWDRDTNNARIYVNGSLEAEGPLPTGTAVANLINEFEVGAFAGSTAFFGKLTEISSHSTDRDIAYIQQAATLPGEGEEKDLDNGDRVLAFTYTIPSDYNYVDGNVRIVEKEEAGPRLQDRIDNPETGDFTFEDIGFGDIPYHENDGDVVYESGASPGTFFFTISKDFIHGREYHYKIFSQNAIGNYSLWSDSPVLSVVIPEFDDDNQRNRVTGGAPTLPTVDNISVQPGNRKLYFQWSIPSLTPVTREVKIYYSNSNFPIVDEQGRSESELIFRGNPDQTEFVHRNIPNSFEGFYTFVTVDRFGYVSAPTYAQSTPLEDADETGIPLLEVRKLRYEVVTDDAISLAWEQPVIFQRAIDGWFDQRVALFAQITDEFGAPIADESNLKFTSSGSVSGAGNSEDVFGETVNRDTTLPTFEEAHILTTTPQGNGVLRGILRMADDFDILSALNSISLSIFVSFTIPDRDNPGSNIFEFNSRPISISLKNPFDMELINLRNDRVEHLCKATVDLNDVLTQSTGGLLVSDQTKTFDGTYIRRQEPFIARVTVTYRGEAIQDGGKVFVAVHEASDPDCDDNESDPSRPFVPGFSDRKSRTVLPPATTIDLLLGEEETDQGITQFSFADTPLQPPEFPQGVMFFAKASYNGFFGRRKLYIAFENTLRIELTAEPPFPDCVDIAEQFASAYMINPDRPSQRIRIPDNEIVKWRLRKGISGKDRPFYSTDNVVNNGPGVFSRITNGTARRVFFGPACGVTWFIFQSEFGPQLLPELYAIRTDIVYDGLSAFDEKPAFIYPTNTGGGFGSRFLMHLRSYQVEMWADGYDYEKLTIWKDPNQAGGLFGRIFRSCADQFGGTIFILNTGQLVEIETANNFEVLYGPDLEIGFDPYIDEPVFSNNEEELGFAVIPLEETTTTEAFLRINQFIGPPDRGGGEPTEPKENRCSAIEFRYREENSDNIITGRTETELDGDIRYLTGGGDAENGIPPCIVRLKEPLDIRIVQVRRDNEPVNELLIDGQTAHTFIVRASFAGRNVPNGTPVRITVGGKNPSKIQVPEQVIFLSNQVDPLVDANEELSLGSFTLLPMSPIQEFEAQVQCEINYDKRGDVERSMTACVTIRYEVQDEQPDEEEDEPDAVINNLYNGTIDRFDTINKIWEVLPNDLNHPRGALTLTWTFDAYGEVLYAIGGIDGASVTVFNEQYRIDSDTWTDMADMPTARFYHQAVEDAGSIYVFGGFSVENNSIVVTRNAERYDPLTDTWSVLTQMPRLDENDFLSYGIAMGACLRVDSKVYFVGGIRLVGSQGGIEELSDRIIVYDINNDSWEVSEPFEGQDLVLYQRVSPFMFYSESDNTLRVSGGAIPIGEGQDQEIIFLTDTFSVDIDTLTISRDEQDYADIPRPRYKGNSAVVDNVAYFLGGETRKAKVSRTFEAFDPSVAPDPFAFEELSGIEVPRQAFGMASDDFQYIYVAGGITSGRPAGFLQINAKVNPVTIRLDGKQSAGVDIELIDDVGENPTDDIRILVRGFVLLPDNEEDDEADDLQGGGGGSDSDQQAAAQNVNRSALIYPVVFSSNDIVAVNGFASTTLLPRSEDILDKVDEIRKKLELARRGEDTDSAEETEPLVINEGDVRSPYQIRVQLTVIDDFYYGQTVVDFQDNEDPQEFEDPGDADADTNDDTDNDGQPDVLPPPPEDPYSPQFEGCRSFSVTQDLPDDPDDGTDDGTDDNAGTLGGNQPIGDDLADRDNPIFDLNPPQTPQLESPTVNYFSDIEWVPQVIPYLNNNQGTAEEALEIVERLRNAVPFGASPFYDGLGAIAEIMLDEELDPFSKVIYVQTDNEESLSFIGLDTALENVQAIDGFAEVPVLVNNFSVVFPVTLSALLARTDTNDLEQIASETGGQSQTVLDANFLDEILNNMIGRAAGSVGFGTYSLVVDLGQISVVNSIVLDYTLFENTDGNWKVSASDDGFNFSESSDQFSPNSEVDFFRLTGRYFKFEVALLSGLSASILEAYENLAAPGVPALTGINIRYSLPKISFLYLNTDSSLFGAQQIAVTIDANDPPESEIQVGVATSQSSSWEDFRTGARPTVDQYGKLFIPIRTQQDETSLNESLINIDGFVWRTEYGSWDLTSTVTVRDATDTKIDPEEYRAYPRQGLIVFKRKRTGTFLIDIENTDQFRIGIQVINRFATEDINIRGMAYMWNTNVFLPPPLSERPPEAQEPKIVPSSPSIYTTISATYRFFDLNGDEEDTDQTQIRWFINGVEVEYLRDITEWNNINNILDPIWAFAFSFRPEDVPDGTSVEQFAREREESILNVGDQVYFTVRPSDGLNFGDTIRSPSVEVAAAPPFITEITIRGRTATGSLQDTVTTSTTAIADFSFFDDGGENTSTIIWYVNGIEFKRGILNESVNGLSNNEIVPGEISGAVVAMIIGNVLEVEVRPAAGNLISDPIRSAPITVENAPPVVSSVLIIPNEPAVDSGLDLSYTFFDNDIAQGSQSQQDESSIRWYRKVPDEEDFIEVSDLANQDFVLAVNTSAGEQWYAEVVPFDGISVGTTVRSNTVTIQDT